MTNSKDVMVEHRSACCCEHSAMTNGKDAVVKQQSAPSCCSEN